MLYNISDHKAYNNESTIKNAKSVREDPSYKRTISHIQTLFTGKRYRHGSHTHTILSYHILIYIHLFIN